MSFFTRRALVAGALTIGFGDLSMGAPAVVAHCMRTATSHLRLSYDDAVILCRGAKTYMPVTCFESALQRFPLILARSAADLCNQANSLAPLTCLQLLIEQDIPLGHGSIACQGA